MADGKTEFSTVAIPISTTVTSFFQSETHFTITISPKNLDKIFNFNFKRATHKYREKTNNDILDRLSGPEGLHFALFPSLPPSPTPCH